jgi:hypothetical protein
MDPSVLQFIAGFFDGDGYVFMTKKYELLLGIRQSLDKGCPSELTHIQAIFEGGRIYSPPSDGKKGNQRKSWKLLYAKLQAVENILTYLEPHCILKHPQVSCALQYFRNNRQNRVETFKILRESKLDYQGVPIPTSKLTTPYLAGLFAADGCVGIYKSSTHNGELKASIAKKNCVRLLAEIKSKLGYGNICAAGYISFSSSYAMTFLHTIKPFLTSSKKLAQVELVEKTIAKYPAKKPYQKRSSEEIAEKDEVIAELKRLKRE